MVIKLIKACKELNIGVSTAVEFLTKNGFEDVQTDPTYRISGDAYLVLAKEFDPIVAQRFTSSEEDVRTKGNRLPAEEYAKVKEIINQCLQDKDSVNLLKIGQALSKQGIKYTGKLKPFLSRFSDSFEIFTDNSINPPVDYIKFHSETTMGSESHVLEQERAEVVKSIGTNTKEITKPVRPIVKKEKRVDKKESAPDLFKDFAWFRNLESELEKLVQEQDLIKEPWLFRGRNELGLMEVGEEGEYPILYNFLKYTFVRLWHETQKNPADPKICEAIDEDGVKYATFNTGLANYKYEYFYAIFEENRILGRQKWVFKGFATEEQKGLGKNILTGLFPKLPSRASYCEDPDDFIFNLPPTQSKIAINVEHIIDHIERLPLWYIESCCQLAEYPYREVQVYASEASSNQYYNDMKERFRSCTDVKLKIDKDFSAALADAILQVEWNYKRAVPIYFSRLNKVCLLLPISLRRGDGIHVAVVIQKRPSKKYTQETVYPISWAYAHARLIAKPDSEWLSASNDFYNIDEADNVLPSQGSSPKEEHSVKTILVTGERYEGTVVSEFNVKKISVNNFPYLLCIKDKNWSKFEDGDKVSFIYQKEPNMYKEDSFFYYTTDLKKIAE